MADTVGKDGTGAAGKRIAHAIAVAGRNRVASAALAALMGLPVFAALFPEEAQAGNIKAVTIYDADGNKTRYQSDVPYDYRNYDVGPGKSRLWVEAGNRKSKAHHDWPDRPGTAFPDRVIFLSNGDTVRLHGSERTVIREGTPMSFSGLMNEARQERLALAANEKARAAGEKLPYPQAGIQGYGIMLGTLTTVHDAVAEELEQDVLRYFYARRYRYGFGMISFPTVDVSGLPLGDVLNLNLPNVPIVRKPNGRLAAAQASRSTEYISGGFLSGGRIYPTQHGQLEGGKYFFYKKDKDGNFIPVKDVPASLTGDFYVKTVDGEYGRLVVLPGTNRILNGQHLGYIVAGPGNGLKKDRLCVFDGNIGDRLEFCYDVEKGQAGWRMWIPGPEGRELTPREVDDFREELNRLERLAWFWRNQRDPELGEGKRPDWRQDPPAEVVIDRDRPLDQEDQPVAGQVVDGKIIKYETNVYQCIGENSCNELPAGDTEGESGRAPSETDPLVIVHNKDGKGGVIVTQGNEKPISVNGGNGSITVTRQTESAPTYNFNATFNQYYDWLKGKRRNPGPPKKPGEDQETWETKCKKMDTPDLLGRTTSLEISTGMACEEDRLKADFRRMLLAAAEITDRAVRDPALREDKYVREVVAYFVSVYGKENPEPNLSEWRKSVQKRLWEMGQILGAEKWTQDKADHKAMVIRIRNEMRRGQTGPACPPYQILGF
ncbi:MAG: hypothetical protein M3O22_08330 [Pseudomonadota bacterium]|nr:hypothetical protein [Pseudomonadota bacterium]